MLSSHGSGGQCTCAAVGGSLWVGPGATDDMAQAEVAVPGAQLTPYHQLQVHGVHRQQELNPVGAEGVHGVTEVVEAGAAVLHRDG